MTDQLFREWVLRRASRHHGLVRTHGLTAAQVKRLRRMADAGRLERVAKGVFRVAGAPPSWRQALWIGLWSPGDTAVVSHAAAGRMHGFDRFTNPRLEFTVDRAHRNRSVPGLPSAVVHSTDRWERGDRVHVDGLPVTSPARTIIDLAGDGAPAVLVETAIDSAVRRRLITISRLARRLELENAHGRANRAPRPSAGRLWW